MDLVLPPVGPGFDLVVEGITGAGGGLGLTVAKQSVVLLEVSTLLGQLDQILGVLEHLGGWCIALEVTNEDDANALAVIVRCMRSLESKATSLVHLSIAGHNKVVANVAETPATLVIRLDVLDHALALLGCGAPVGIVGMMNDHIVHGTGNPRRGTSSHCTPTAAGLNLQGIGGES